MTVKLPKQWRDWMRTANIRLHGKPLPKKYKKFNGFYMKGRGYVWRVNGSGEFEMGDTTAEFDRWALCDIDKAPLPTTKSQFLDTINIMLKARRNERR